MLNLPFGRQVLALASSRLTARSYASISPQSNKIRKILHRKVDQLPSIDQIQPCISASKCQRYDLSRAREIFMQNKISSSVMEPGEALWAELPNSADVFVLGNGSVVGWGITEQKLVFEVVNMLSSAEKEPFVHIETEDMDYVEESSNDTQSGMVGDVIFIHGPSKSSRRLDKLAFSSGMARHTKLSTIEVDTEQILQQVKQISSDMSEGKHSKLNSKQVDILTGRLLQLRGTLNLYSNITETPDIYWSQPQQESLYELISKSLDVEPRIKILNNKLDYAADMVGILRHHISERKSLRVEWLIVALILIEVAIELKKTLPELWSEYSNIK